MSPETILHFFLFIWQWRQLVFYSDTNTSLQNCFLTISSSSCAAHCFFSNFHLSFLEKHPIILRWCNLLGFFWILSILQCIDSPIQLGIVFPLIIYSLLHYPGYSWIFLPDPGQIPEDPTKIYAAIFFYSELLIVFLLIRFCNQFCSWKWYFHLYCVPSLLWGWTVSTVSEEGLKSKYMTSAVSLLPIRPVSLSQKTLYHLDIIYS